MTAVGADTRGRVIKIASSITSERRDAVAVVRNAIPMLFWLEAAADDADLGRRLAALDQMWANSTPEDCGRSLMSDAPAEFVAGAQVLYQFVTADDAPADVPDDARSLTGGDV
jgi:hypothetical protein